MTNKKLLHLEEVLREGCIPLTLAWSCYNPQDVRKIVCHPMPPFEYETKL